MPMLLQVIDVTRRFGGLAAVANLNLEVQAGELVGLIGPNGAGKTTVFNLLTGVYAPSEGDILFDGVRINGKKPFRVTALGMARTFQNIRLFANLTAGDNVRVGAHLHTHASLFDSLMGNLRSQRDRERLDDVATRVLNELELSAYVNVRAADLPYGLQRRLEIARALATKPKLLLLDEPAAGLNPSEKADLMALIRRIRDDFKLTILLIEHDMRLVMGVCERIYVLDYGKIIAEGPPASIQRDPVVIAAYLGSDDAETAVQSGDEPTC